MDERLADLCAHPAEQRLERAGAEQAALTPGIFLSSVYRCQDPAHAESLLSGAEAGYVYQRDGHPNGSLLADRCRQLHGADWACVTSSGMAALAAATLHELRVGRHVLVSEQLYGKTLHLLTRYWTALGVEISLVNSLDVAAVAAAMRDNTSLLVVETVSNPMLRVSPLQQLADLAHAHQAKLLVDNTLATPYLCRPLEWGADLVMESVSKMMNGHSDVMLGMLCGRGDLQSEYRDVISSWGLASSPFDCWLALRGLMTFHLRMQAGCRNAQGLAERMVNRAEVGWVQYPGLKQHPDRSTICHQFGSEAGGTMLTFDLPGGAAAVSAFLAASGIPYCPSLGELSTTLSHPASASHRSLTEEQRARLGISSGTVRLSVGTESLDGIWQALEAGLVAAHRSAGG